MLYDRRYWKESLLWGLPYVLGCILVFSAREQLAVGDPLRILLAVPVLALAGLGLWVELRQIRRFDELQRRIYGEAWLHGGVAGMVGCLLTVLLEGFVGPPEQAPLWVLLAMALGFCVGWARAARRYA